MYCPKCGVQIPDDSAFCKKCGAPTGSKDTNPGPGAAAVPAPLSVSASKEPEGEVWKGRFSGKSYIHLWLLYVVYLGLLIYVILAMLKPQESWLRWTCVAALVLPAAYLGLGVLYYKISVRYRLTNYRLFKEIGIISRKISEVELMRVDDVEVQQNFLQRIFNVGNVLVLSSDSTDPRLELEGINDPVSVKEQIRANVQKRRAGNLRVDTV